MRRSFVVVVCRSLGQGIWRSNFWIEEDNDKDIGLGDLIEVAVLACIDGFALGNRGGCVCF